MADPTPRPRGDGEELGLVDGLVQLSFLLQGILGEAGSAVGLTVVQLRLLGALRGRQPTMGQVARHLGLDKSSVSGLVDRAERRGLVARDASPDDGRSIRVSLTGEGEALARAVGADVARRIDQLVEGLSAAEAEELATLAGRLVSGGGPGPARR
jgi:DNA-binding MarR family transcriptional regulator